MEQKIHKTHKKDDGVVERNLLESLEELGITGVWNNSSEAIQGVTGCFFVTVVWRRGHRNCSVLQPSSSFLVSISAGSSLLTCPPSPRPCVPAPTLTFALVIHAAAHSHQEKAEGIESSPKEEDCASR